LCIDTLAHWKTQSPRHQGRRQIDVDVVLLEAVFVADFDHVAKTFSGQQRSLGALALDHRIGRKRRAVDNQPDLSRRYACRPRHDIKRRKHASLRRPRGGQRLGGEPAFADLERHVSKRAADIEAEPDCGVCHFSNSRRWTDLNLCQTGPISANRATYQGEAARGPLRAGRKIIQPEQ